MNQTPKSAELEKLQRCIRSGSSLLNLLAETGIFRPMPGTNHQDKVNPITEMLEASAHSLVRWPGETIAVGLTADHRSVSASRHESTLTEPTKWFQEETDSAEWKFHNFVAAKNSAGPKGSSDERPLLSAPYLDLVKVCADTDQLALHVLEYRSFTGEKCDRQYNPENSLLTSDSRRKSHPPSFDDYAQSVFFLLRKWLKAPSDDDITAAMVPLYVTGMSLTRLVKKLDEPVWKTRTSRHKPMHDFLEESLNVEPFLLSEENITSKSEEENAEISSSFKDDLDQALRICLEKNKQTPEDVRSLALNAIDRGKIDKFVANAFHFMIRIFVNELEELTGDLQKRVFTPEGDPLRHPRAEQRHEIISLVDTLLCLNNCVTDMDQIMTYYIRGIRVPAPFPKTPVQSSEHLSTLGIDDEVPEEEKDNANEITNDLSFVEAYKLWLQGIVRPVRCALVLTQARDSPWKKNVLAMDLKIITEGQTNKEMQGWEDTIKKAFSGQVQDPECVRILQALSALAAVNNKDKDSSFKILQSESWQRAFTGACHCESMLGVESFLSAKESSTAVRCAAYPSGHTLTIHRLDIRFS